MDLPPNNEVVAEEPTIDELRTEIDELDNTILDLVKRRTQVGQLITRARMAEGGARVEHAREREIIARYTSLGPDGMLVANVLLRLSRGRLGH